MAIHMPTNEKRNVRGRAQQITDSQMAAWIRSLRTYLGWTHINMAAYCGLWKQSYMNLEQSGRPGGPVLKHLDSLAREHGFYTHGELMTKEVVEMMKQSRHEKVDHALVDENEIMI